MGDTPAIDNKLAARINGVVHTIWGMGFVAGREAIKTYVPFLRLPVISQLFDLLIGRFGAIIDRELQLNATFIVITIQTRDELTAYEKSKQDLKLAQTQGDPNAISEAQKKLKEDLAKLIHWDGSVPH